MQQIALFVAILALAVSAGAQDYTTRIIYSEPNLRPGISFLNNFGQVTGTKYYSAPVLDPFIWSKSTKSVSLGNLGGGLYNYSDGINDAGQVIGDSDLADQVSHHAYFWSASAGIQDIGTFGGTQSYPGGINKSGRVVGSATLFGDQIGRAFLWTQSGGLQDIGAGDNSTAIAINTSGQILGARIDSQNNYQGFVWSQASGFQFFYPPVATLMYLVGISDSGQVLGNYVGPQCTLSQSTCAFTWSPNVGFQYPALNGSPINAISQNAAGTVLGDIPNSRAVLWTSSGGAQDLGVLPGKSFSYPYALNNKNEVVGLSCIADGTHCKSFVWHPGQGLRVIPHSNNAKIFTQLNDAGQIVGIVAYNRTVLLSPWVRLKLASSQNPSKLGQSVIFTATASSVEGAPKDGELVVFRTGKKVLGTAPLSGGVASFATTSLTVGRHAVTATYSGDANYDTSKSGVLQQILTP